MRPTPNYFLFFFNDTATTEIYTLSLHDALPISEIKERVDYELSIITKKKYETYFLVVADFVNWAKDNNIAVGPGDRKSTRLNSSHQIISYAVFCLKKKKKKKSAVGRFNSVELAV